MIKEIVQKWEENKLKLEEYFKTTNQSEYQQYSTIVEKLIAFVINTNENSYDNFAIDNMTVIDNGDYQGTLIFIIPKNTYQPSVSDYIMTSTYYGSCSGCDTLQGICGYSDDLPDDDQVGCYMMLALHLVQNMKWLNSNE